MEFPLLVNLRPSRLFAAAHCTLHGMALFGIWATPWDLRLQLVLSLCALTSGGAGYWRARPVPARLLLHRDGRIAVFSSTAANALPQTARAASPLVALPGFCVLRLAWEDETPRPIKTLVFFPDSADAESLRHLRIWLTFCAGRGKSA
ncbi:MAG: hypothetical protein LBR88_04895 [Zoogloeaceae bacterium]|nr:hypothetical protein [Zoogloeaceae bacterium]